MNSTDKVFGVIVAGVGGQGAVTVAQLILGAAWKSGYHVLQSEVHGMSQRGGSVNAQILFDKKEVTSPLITEGRCNLLISLEPLETLRYLSWMSPDAHILTANGPVKNMQGYPADEELFAELGRNPNIVTLDTETFKKELNNRHAPNMILLGASSKLMPFTEDVWSQVIRERFSAQSEEIIQKNLIAFDFGRKLSL